jgi:predicted porin
MKKLAIAAALAAITTGVSAQNVAVYGTIGASVAEREISGVKTTAQGNGDYLSSSVLGFRGTEDLGGGMKASFNLEGDLNVGNGTGDGTGGGLTFDRQSWVELSTGVVAARVGRLQDIAKDAYGYGSAGANLFDVSGTAPFSTVQGLGNRYPQSTRLEATVAGFRVSGSYTNDVTGSAAGDGQGTQASTVGAEGRMGPVSTIAAYTKRGEATGYAVGGRFKVGTGEIGATYNTHDNGAASPVKAKAYQVGAVVPVGAGFNVRASYAKNDSDTVTADADFWGVMLEKAFSKRTSAYVGYSDLDVNNGITGDTKIATLGLQHKF